MADHSNINTGKVNPTRTMTNAFDISLDTSRLFVNPAIRNYPRESIGCSSTTGPCGEFGALRESGGRTHNGIDIMTRIDSYIIAEGDGAIRNTTTKDKKTGVVLPGINLFTDNGLMQTLYTQSGNNEKDPIKNSVTTNQGNIIGRQVDIKKNPSYSDTVNHSHVEIFEKYTTETVKDKETGLPKQINIKTNHKDPTNILFPNKVKVPIGLPNNNNIYKKIIANIYHNFE